MIELVRRVLEGKEKPHALIEYVESETGPLTDDELAELLEEIEARRAQYPEDPHADKLLAAYVLGLIDRKRGRGE